jgi:hypothetical protein
LTSVAEVDLGSPVGKRVIPMVRAMVVMLLTRSTLSLTLAVGGGGGWHGGGGGGLMNAAGNLGGGGGGGSGYVAPLAFDVFTEDAENNDYGQVVISWMIRNRRSTWIPVRSW